MRHVSNKKLCRSEKLKKDFVHQIIKKNSSTPKNKVYQCKKVLNRSIYKKNHYIFKLKKIPATRCLFVFNKFFKRIYSLIVALYWCREKKTKFRDSMGRIILVYFEKSYALILFKIFKIQ